VLLRRCDSEIRRLSMSRGKIGIFLPGRYGDMMQAMSVLKYKDVLWPDKDIVWFCGNTPFREVLNYNDAISEIRHWPEGWKLPERCVDENRKLKPGEPLWADMNQLRDANSHLDQSRKHEFEFTKDLEQGYFPAPWMVPSGERPGVDYPNVSRKVFGADPSWEWHPYLGFSDEEREAVKEFCSRLPHKKTVMLETDFASGVSQWDDNLTRETMAMCRQKFGRCNFIFVCAGDNSRFFDDSGVVSCSQFTVRQTALVNNYSDLFIGISSGISQAVNCWGNKPIPKLQYCGSFIMSSVSIANGPFELVVSDPARSNPPEHELRFPPNPMHRKAYKTKLSSILSSIGG
jgi:hypothetical protein